ncbi:inactive TPR repeat-containing thioredoxin TTL3-like [Mangifera indica]|uniref:inactive TPR repeat-containing thioredoxin TTL3-like n=1 Tax=Mangifera indica TaxID=29780 RepID=UPI001CF9D9D0|nr:inactive TPR repeat-containing thioredoxin TTL3-like [Mangifera indica]
MMSHSKKFLQDINFDSLTNRFADSLTFNDDNNKPDFKELDLGSPVSPLLTRGSVTNANGVTTSTSSSISSGSASAKSNTTPQLPKNKTKNNSGELSGPPGSGPAPRNLKPGHRRSVSAGPPLIYSGSSFSTASSSGSMYNGNGAHSVSINPNAASVLPSGNICPSGKTIKTGMACRVSNRTDTLGTGMGNYGHGSIVRGYSNGNNNNNNNNAKLGNVADAEEVKRAGNEMYKKGNFVEALKLYDKAISISPENAAYRSNRAAALTAIGRLGEAVSECEEAVRLDPAYMRAHQRLGSLYLRLGQVESVKHHLFFPGQRPDPAELHKLQSFEKHLNRCADGRKIDDWKSVVREADAAMAIGVDSSPQIVACKAEALLKLHRIEDADICLSNIPRFEHYPPASQAKFFGMAAEAYVLCVQAQVEVALGRFENAVSAAEKAVLIDSSDSDIATVLKNVKMVVMARTRGNDLFSSGRYAEACSAYGEGLKYDSCNSVLYCNRAVCWSKLGFYEKSIEDCNEALKIQPNYTKVLHLRAVSNGKLGQWSEAVRDYEALRKELPGDNEVTESLHLAQIALRKSSREFTNTMKLGGEVEEVLSLEKFKAAISSPGVSIVHFKVESSEKCEEISPFVNTLCIRYPSVHFFKVDVEESLAIAKAEGIRAIPTFKIYKNGDKLKEMICPSHQILEESVRSYIL